VKRLCLALSLAASAASAQDCDRQPFPLEPRLPRAAVKPERSGQPTPPEIARIRNGVISASAGIPPGVGPLYQAWLAYDFDRAIFIAVDSASRSKSSWANCCKRRCSSRSHDAIRGQLTPNF